jgi:hypothetical protein
MKAAVLALAPLALGLPYNAYGQWSAPASADTVPVTAVTCDQRLAGSAINFSLTAHTVNGRAVPLTILAPAVPGTYRLVAFSHGAFATPERYLPMLEPLAGAGFIIIAPMHIDSEEYPRAAGDPRRPPHDETWATRNEDFALALAPTGAITEALHARGLNLAQGGAAAVGHSYGALIAQLPGGALAMEPDGSRIVRTDASVNVVVGWSPPGPMPGLMDEQGWSSLVAPTLTITGTADTLPGFIDDWRAHRASHDYAPEGRRGLWVGENIDHYFGGVFGRIKQPSKTDRALFDRALATMLNFIERRTGVASPCVLGAPISGETFKEDLQ